MEILGVRIDNISISEVLEEIKEFLCVGGQHQIVTVNPEFIVKAQKDAEFKEILNKADLAIADGTGIVWASRILGEPLKERVSGVDLVEKLKAQSSKFKIKDQNAKIFLLGGRNKVAKKIATEWPAVVGFSEEKDGTEPFTRIRQCQPVILLVALGAPGQEKWIAENLTKFPSVKLAIGVGGAFDMISGKISRAPRFMQKLGLEWLWRLILQPSRIGRIFDAVIVFPWLVFKSRVKKTRE